MSNTAKATNEWNVALPPSFERRFNQLSKDEGKTPDALMNEAAAFYLSTPENRKAITELPRVKVQLKASEFSIYDEDYESPAIRKRFSVSSSLHAQFNEIADAAHLHRSDLRRRIFCAYMDSHYPEEVRVHRTLYASRELKEKIRVAAFYAGKFESDIIGEIVTAQAAKGFSEILPQVSRLQKIPDGNRILRNVYLKQSINEELRTLAHNNGFTIGDIIRAMVEASIDSYPTHAKKRAEREAAPL